MVHFLHLLESSIDIPSKVQYCNVVGEKVFQPERCYTLNCKQQGTVEMELN